MVSSFDSLPSRLLECSQEKEIAGVPCLLVQKDEKPRPFLFWIHGRTADKELDPGRYLRCMRRGINVCAVDLPGHGQRFEHESQSSNRVLEVVLQMTNEIDSVLEGLADYPGFDLNAGAIGGMSAGGLVAILRLLRPHPFKSAVLEATGGSWTHLRHSPICEALSDEEFHAVNPINRLNKWRDIPVIAFHSRHDSWMPFAAESEFIDALKMKSQNPEHVELVAFDYTGAPDEHMGFGRQTAFVKETQVEFLARHLLHMKKVTP
jgi:pimeloyl-ACP methyl ester carboxylesterase